MSKTHVPKALRQLIERQAQYRCGYCHTQEVVIGVRLVPDHLLPEALGGETVEDNLWLACRRCNEGKGGRIEALDPETNAIVPLFNPRVQKWEDHFSWLEKGIQIEGTTKVGRATVKALSLNNPYIIKSRRRWVAVGWHPPK